MTKILIAEDEPVSRHLLQSSLQKWGYETVAVGDGEEAWEKINEINDIKLAIIDWVMPRMDGLSFCRTARKDARFESLYIILLTSKDSMNDMVEGLKAGADDYLTKPFDKDELKVRLQVGMRIVNLQKTLAEREKLQGVLEMAGASCHELNQPAQAILGYADMTLLKIDESHPFYKALLKIKEQAVRLGKITQKLMNVTKYVTKDYLDGSKIIDIEEASSSTKDQKPSSE